MADDAGLPFCSGQVEKDFLTENHIYFVRQLPGKACLFAQKGEPRRIYLLEYGLGLFLLNVSEVQVLARATQVSTRVLEGLAWKSLQFLKRSARLVLLNYFQHYESLLREFPELDEDAQTLPLSLPSLSPKTQQFYYQLLERVFIGPPSRLRYTDTGIQLAFDNPPQMTLRRARTQLELLQTHDFLQHRSLGNAEVELRFNRQRLHFNEAAAPHFFKQLMYGNSPALPLLEEVSEPQVSYQVQAKKKQSPLLMSEAEFISQYENQLKTGSLAEEKVLEYEKNNLIARGLPELAARVHSVAQEVSRGYDIVSYEADGLEKQIEVKAVRTRGEIQSFFISSGELEKAKLLPNYYLYAVENVYSESPLIHVFHRPDFGKEPYFQLDPIGFQVRYPKPKS